MTLEELTRKEDHVKTTIDNHWDEVDCYIAYAYLHRGGLRISEVEKSLGKLLLAQEKSQ